MGGFGIPGPLQVNTIRLYIQFRKLLAEVILQSLCGVLGLLPRGLDPLKAMKVILQYRSFEVIHK